MNPLTNKVTAPPAGGDLAARFSAPLLSYFLRRVRDRSQAEDLVQDALLRVIRASECEVIEHPESYVFKVAANLLKDSRRHAVRHPTITSPAIEEDAGNDVGETLIDERSPERVLDGETSLAQVLQALSELSELTRNVFILFRLEHMKQKDIAALYGIGQSTVEKHVMRAVLHLGPEVRAVMTRDIDLERLEQAAAWRARLAESADLHAGEFSSWLAQDPRNRKAWRRMQAPWDVLGQQATAPGVIRLRRAALAHAHNAMRSNLLWPKRFRRPAMLAAAAACAVAAGAFLFWQQSRQDVFRTGFGERRIVTLSDGSQLTLDSRSEVAVRYTADARALTLVRGQAQFDVAHDVVRPFSVTAQGQKVVATGTAFDVDVLGPKLLVTLLKGHVVVMPQSAPTRAWVSDAARDGAGSATEAGTESRALSAAGDAQDRIYLDPGEQLVMSSSDVPRVTRVDVDRVTAWERGEIVFDNEPLASVIQRMNRYGPRHISVADDSTGSLRISGVFHEGDVDGFVSTIAAYLSVRAHERPDGDVVLTYHASSASRQPGS